MKKILFLIHDLGPGGAERVLVNLVNNLDRKKFDISVIALFGGGVMESYLRPDIKYRSVFSRMIPANSKWMKLWSPGQLHHMYIKEHYDVEISYLEGPSARVISGCDNPDTKLVSWIHVEQHTKGKLARSFRSFEEAAACYNRYNQTICVSEDVLNDFKSILDFKKPCKVLYNTNETSQILEKSIETAEEIKDDGRIRLIAVGTLKESKGYTRLLQIVKKLKEKEYKICLYILGEGPMRAELERSIIEMHLEDTVYLLGYKSNPYKYLSASDLFVCASFAEGFSTAATESLIVGTPVCTVDVSGMKEMLGRDNEYGIVTENSEEGLLQGIRAFLDDPVLLDSYREKAAIRGKAFSKEETVNAVEEMLLNL